MLRLLVDPRVTRLAFLGWWLGWLAVLASTLTPGIEELPLDLSDKAWHVIGFGLMTAAAAGFAHDRARLLAWAAFTLAMGGLIEWAQGFVPGRSPDPLDLAADALGVALGLGLALAWLAAVVWPLRRRPRPLPRPA